MIRLVATSLKAGADAANGDRKLKQQRGTIAGAELRLNFRSVTPAGKGCSVPRGPRESVQTPLETRSDGFGAFPLRPEPQKSYSLLHRLDSGGAPRETIRQLGQSGPVWAAHTVCTGVHSMALG